MAGRILVADSQASNRILLKAKLSAAHYYVDFAEAAGDVVRLARAGRPDVVLVGLTGTLDEALSACRALRSDPATADIALIALAAANDQAARRAALEAGADDVLNAHCDDALLLARIRGLMRARYRNAEYGLHQDARDALGFAEAAPAFEGPGVIAIISDDTDRAETLSGMLAPHLRDTIITMTPSDLLDDVSMAVKPDVYIINTGPEARKEGLGLIADLRSHAEGRIAGILAVLDEGDAAGAVTALDLGADDVIGHPIDPIELVLRLRLQMRRKAQTERMRRQVSDGLRLAVTDPLTGLYNRRYALSHLSRIAAHAVETGQPFAVMVLDVDRFKRVNDTYGHVVGDAVLVEVARRIAGGLRAVDLVARLGGEEFLVVMPETSVEAARIAGERLRQAVAAQPFSAPGLPEPLALTVSIGVALGGSAGKNPADALVSLADRALYDAKAEGRNQVTFSQSAA